ncbi:MAG: riboflavin biosynthesis protein RibF [Bacteroidota bacterium]|nr:riboflavin biosynthesis protein RibF [Bacteroidota bacterium]
MAVVTTGFFDGVHLGHRHVLETLVSSARERGEEALVVTFWPHPRAVLQQDARDFRLLTSLEEKKALLLGCGVDRVEVIPFTRAFAAMTAAEYLDLLREKYCATLVVMGYDNRIGSDHKTAAELPGVVVVDEVGNDSLSSTKIRRALEDGDVTGAAAMLGRPYALQGVVVAGNRLGRTIGFPTANMQLYEPLKLVPGNGVYAVEVDVLGQKYRGMTNIGTRPTVGGTSRTIETHILDFDQDIYGLPLEIRFLRRIRSEIHFPSLDALRVQLEKDRLACEG